NLRVAPPRVAEGMPGIEIAAMATDVDHGVDRTRAAEHLATRPEDLSPIEVGFLLRPVRPIDLTTPQGAPGGWKVDVWPGIRASGFEEEHRRGGVFRQAMGEHTASRPGADDNVIIPRCFFHRCFLHTG